MNSNILVANYDVDWTLCYNNISVPITYERRTTLEPYENKEKRGTKPLPRKSNKKMVLIVSKTYTVPDTIIKMIEDNCKPPDQLKTKNKGTGAGGANTNYYGKLFEEKTNNQSRLLEMGYTMKRTMKNKYDYYLSKTFEDKTIIFVLQNGLKKYIKSKYGIELFRCPDEAYIIEYNTGKTVIKILEKKEQNVEGSVETKLWSGPTFKEEYQLVLGDRFEVHYGFCVSDFLKKKLTSNDKKYETLMILLKRHNIAVLFGDDENYFETFDAWLNL